MHMVAFMAVRAARSHGPAPSSPVVAPADVEVDLTQLAPAEEPFAAANANANAGASVEGPHARPVPEHVGVHEAPQPASTAKDARVANANLDPGVSSATPAPSTSATTSAEPGWHMSVFGNPGGPSATSAGAAGSSGMQGPGTIPGVASAALGAAKPASTTFGLREGLAARDLEVGLTRGGFVRSAVEAAVHSDTAPASGTARYDVRVLRDGTAIVVLDHASVDHAGFAALTSTIKRHIDPKKLRLPDGSTGLHVVIDVDIHDQYPDGRKPSEVGQVRGYIGPGEYDITKDGFLIRKMPGATIAFTGKVCSGGVYIGPAGLGLNGGCSFENAGVPARRMGSAKIVSEGLL